MGFKHFSYSGDALIDKLSPKQSFIKPKFGGYRLPRAGKQILFRRRLLSIFILFTRSFAP